MASWINLLVMAFLVWFSYEVWVEKLLVTSIRLSCMSVYVMRLSFFWYLLFWRSQPSIADTKALRAALSGLPPCSSHEL